MEDLSHLAEKSISAGSSMAGGNMISDPPWGALPGTESEQTSAIDLNRAVGTPDPDIGTPTEKYETKTGPEGYKPSALTWKKAK